MAATAVAVGTMKVAQVPKPGGDFQMVERKIPEARYGTRAHQGAGVWCVP